MTGVTPDQVTAVLVTRGDVDLTAALETLPFDDIRIWSNATGNDLAVFGRYAGLQNCRPVVYVQDDDCVLPAASIADLLAAYEPGHVTCNMPQAWRDQPFYERHALVGFGSVFDRDLPEQAFARYLRSPGNLGAGGLFLRCCDVVFTALTPRVLVDVPYTNLPWATGPDRMYRQPTHFGERVRMLEATLKAADRETAAA